MYLEQIGDVGGDAKPLICTPHCERQEPVFSVSPPILQPNLVTWLKFIYTL